MRTKDSGLSRRDALGALVAAPALLTPASLAACDTLRQDNEPPAHAGAHAIVPLPFDPKALTGISEKMIVSHHDNNYAAAIKSLNKVEVELRRVNKDTPGFVVAGLKERELLFRNSMTYHEHYFANLGGDGKLTGDIDKEIARCYGGTAKWEELFRATGASLGGGSGWTVLAFDLYQHSLITYWSSVHTQGQSSSIPVLVMDMYEHAYQMDYGAAAAKYIDAFFANIHYGVVNARLAKALKASAALRA